MALMILSTSVFFALSLTGDKICHEGFAALSLGEGGVSASRMEALSLLAISMPLANDLSNLTMDLFFQRDRSVKNEY
jgi:hypothetical protein